MRRFTLAACAAVALPAIASLVFAPSAVATTHGTYSPKLRQELPRTATDEGAPQQGAGTCADIPETQDGWHFVLPGNEAKFVKLTVTFEPGGEQVITDFGPPSDKHAYVASEAGATLTSVVAEVKGGDLKKFNLSHTCPAASQPSEEPSDEPSEEPSNEPSGESSGEPGEEPSGEPGEEPSGEPGGEPSDNAAGPAASPSATAQGGTGDLAETGSGAPVGMIATGAVVLLGAGALLARRRLGSRH